MSKFNIGDRVVLLEDYDMRYKKGDTGVVTAIDPADEYSAELVYVAPDRTILKGKVETALFAYHLAHYEPVEEAEEEIVTLGDVRELIGLLDTLEDAESQLAALESEIATYREQAAQLKKKLNIAEEN